MNGMQIVYLCIVIIGVIGAIVSGFWAYYEANNSRVYSDFHKKNRNSETLWGFTRRNFPIFLTLFFIVIVVTCIVMLIQ